MSINQDARKLIADRLWHALEQGKEIEAVSLIKNYGMVHSRHPVRGLYPLSAAALWGQADVCRALLAGGANPNSQDSGSEDTPLYSALSGGRMRKRGLEILKLLIDAGADMNLFLPEKGSASAFLIACGIPLRDFKDKVELMVHNGGRMEATDFQGMGVMHYVAITNPDNIRTLAKLGGNANAQDDEGNTPLHRAAEMGSSGNFKALLAAGADPRTKNHKGLTALDCRVIEVNDEVDPREEMVARWMRRKLREEARSVREKLSPKKARNQTRRM